MDALVVHKNISLNKGLPDTMIFFYNRRLGNDERKSENSGMEGEKRLVVERDKHE